MNPSSLHALIVDQHFGELAPEVAELLQAFLAENAAARAESARILRALNVTAETVRLHPELAQPEAPRPASPPRSRHPSWLAQAAAIAALATLASAGGFLAGQKHPSAAKAGPSDARGDSRPERKDSPWARYRIASAAGGTGLQIVRVDVPNHQGGAAQ
jgi:hypothetical protein